MEKHRGEAKRKSGAEARWEKNHEAELHPGKRRAEERWEECQENRGKGEKDKRAESRWERSPEDNA